MEQSHHGLIQAQNGRCARGRLRSCRVNTVCCRPQAILWLEAYSRGYEHFHLLHVVIPQLLQNQIACCASNHLAIADCLCTLLQAYSLMYFAFRLLLLLSTYCCFPHRYDGIIDLTRKLNSKYSRPQETQAATKRILKTLFPGWLPPAFSVCLAHVLFTSLSPELNIDVWHC